jgi:hypothetical protein
LGKSWENGGEKSLERVDRKFSSSDPQLCTRDLDSQLLRERRAETLCPGERRHGAPPGEVDGRRCFPHSVRGPVPR